MEIVIVLVLTALMVIWIICKDRGEKSQKSETTHTRPPASVPTFWEPCITYNTSPPPIPNAAPQLFDYQAGWWKVYSLWYRSEKGWRCEACQLSLYEDKHLLHTHHVWGTLHNEPQDLMALCIGCHSEQPGRRHQNLKNTENYQNFIATYGKKWRLRRYEYQV